MTATEFLVVLTVTKASNRDMAMSTIWRTVTVTPGTTRESLLRWAINQLPDQVRGGVVTFFSVEPNTLPGVTP
ncbi:hypothetical protein [Rhizohabitans arisaemae]|uniref:hypothetical protein n=1 Tax=Rhizohabitans arisaemae TaxID=2720610 RepID=UPI0024B06057|nr:hypothetical protein [Rhizohabitans arisaemae]